MKIFFEAVVTLLGISALVFSLTKRHVGGIKGYCYALLMTVGGLAAVIGALFLFGPAVTGTVVLCAAAGFIPFICVYNIIIYCRLKKYGGRCEGYLYHWGVSSKSHPHDCPVIGYVATDGEQMSFEFRNNIFLTEKRCLRGVDIIFDMKRPEKAYVVKFSLMSYITGLVVFMPLLVMTAIFSIDTITA